MFLISCYSVYFFFFAYKYIHKKKQYGMDIYKATYHYGVLLVKILIDFSCAGKALNSAKGEANLRTMLRHFVVWFFFSPSSVRCAGFMVSALVLRTSAGSWFKPLPGTWCCVLGQDT